MYRSIQFAIAGVVVGASIATVAVVRSSSPDPAAEAVPAAAQPNVVDQPPGTQLEPAAAVEFWQARVDAAPRGVLDRTQLGWALLHLARDEGDLDAYSSAEVVFGDALEIDDDSSTARLGLARALHAQHDFATSAAITDSLVAEDPGDLDALATLGDARFELGDLDAAREAYDELAAAERSAPVLSRLSRLAFATGDSDEAVGLAEEALATSERLVQRPNERAFAWFQLGHVRFDAGDVDGSIAALERALEISPGHGGATERLAFVYASVDRLADAAMLYEQLIAEGAAADLHGSYADVLRALGDDDAAAEQEVLGRALADETRGMYPAEQRHLISFELTRDPVLAVELAEEDLATRQDAGAYDALAWSLFHAGRVDEAAELVDDMLASGVEDPELLYHAGAIAAAVGEVEMARVLVADALAINPTFHPSEADDARALIGELG